MKRPDTSLYKMGSMVKLDRRAKIQSIELKELEELLVGLLLLWGSRVLISQVKWNTISVA